MTRFKWMHFLKVPTRATSDSSELPASTKFVHNVVDAGGGSGGSGAAISFSVSQTAHGFAVLTPVFYDIGANAWAKAKANSADTLATHVVTAVADADTFTAGQVGKFTVTGHGFAEGFWFTSAETEGSVVQSDSTYSNPVFFVIDANTVFLPGYRPAASEGLFGMTEAVAITAAITLGETAIGKLHVCSGTSADYTIILPSPANHSGKYIGFHMDPALTKLVTLDAGVGLTIDGERYRKMRDREVAILRSDGSTWTKVAGKTVPMSGCLRVGGNQTFNASTTTRLTNFTLSNSLDAPAAFQTAASSLFTILRPGKYRVVGGSITNSTNSSAGDTQIYLKKNSVLTKGNAMRRNASAFVSLYVETTQVFAAGDVLDLYGYYSGGSFTTSFLYSGDSGMFSEFSVTEIPTW